jgi:hypothetical protein
MRLAATINSKEFSPRLTGFMPSAKAQCDIEARHYKWLRSPKRSAAFKSTERPGRFATDEGK